MHKHVTAPVGIGIILLICFVVLAWMASPGPLPIDLEISRMLELYDHDVLETLNWLTSVHIWALIIGGVAGGLWLNRSRFAGATLGLALVLAEASSFIIKWAVERPRPPGATFDDIVTTASFPSGHAVRVAVTLGVLFILFAWQWRQRYRVLSVLGLCLVLVILGIARVATADHWASDVAGGYLLGGAWLAFATVLIPFIKGRSQLPGGAETIQPLAGDRVAVRGDGAEQGEFGNRPP